jgi:hypothetical protein
MEARMTSASRSKGEDVAAVAATLTEPQAHVLNELSDYPESARRRARPMDVSCHYGRKAAPILRQLCKKGLADFYNWASAPCERGSCRYWITPAGLAVIAHLTDQEGQNR